MAGRRIMEAVNIWEHSRKAVPSSLPVTAVTHTLPLVEVIPNSKTDGLNARLFLKIFAFLQHILCIFI